MPPLRAIIKGDLSTATHAAEPVNPHKVFIGGQLAVVTGDIYGVAPDHPGNGAHPSAAGQGSSRVFIGNTPLFRETDLLVCGDVAKVTDPTRNVYSG